jgi:hypothetical protein
MLRESSAGVLGAILAISAFQAKAPDAIKAKSLDIVDSKGKTRIRLESETIELIDARGKTLLTLSTDGALGRIRVKPEDKGDTAIVIGETPNWGMFLGFVGEWDLHGNGTRVEGCYRRYRRRRSLGARHSGKERS